MTMPTIDANGRVKISYKGHEIEVFREESMGGEALMYYSVFREEDGFECTSGFTYDDSAPFDYSQHLVKQIDEELQKPDPWDEECDESGEGDADLFSEQQDIARYFTPEDITRIEAAAEQANFPDPADLVRKATLDAVDQIEDRESLTSPNHLLTCVIGQLAGIQIDHAIDTEDMIADLKKVRGDKED